MTKQRNNAALFDLFDQGSASQPGGRQMDLETLIAERARHDARVKALDAAMTLPKSSLTLATPATAGCWSRLPTWRRSG